MIYFIVQRWHDYTMRNFLDAWGQSVRARVKIVDYDYLALTRKLPFGTYVFTDHDRMTEAQTEMASAVADQLVAAGPAAAKVLSHPRTTKSRVPFLRAMNELGINDFRVFRAALEPLPADLKFPVFLRLSNNHKGGLTEPLHTRADFVAALERPSYSQPEGD